MKYNEQNKPKQQQAICQREDINASGSDSESKSVSDNELDIFMTIDHFSKPDAF